MVCRRACRAAARRRGSDWTARHLFPPELSLQPGSTLWTSSLRAPRPHTPDDPARSVTDYGHVDSRSRHICSWLAMVVPRPCTQPEPCRHDGNIYHPERRSGSCSPRRCLSGSSPPGGAGMCPERACGDWQDRCSCLAGHDNWYFPGHADLPGHAYSGGRLGALLRTTAGKGFPDNPLPDERGLSAEFFKFSLRNYPGALLDGAPVFLLPVLVLRLVGATDYAYFFVAWSVSGVIGLLAAAVGQVALRESAARDDQRVLAVRARLLVLAVTGSAVLILLPAAGLVLHIFGSSYASFSVLPLRLLVLSAIPGAHLTITIALLRGRKRYSAVNQSSVAYAALSIGASVGLGAIAGVPGVCAGWLIGVSLSAAVATLVAARRPSDAVISESDRSIILEDSRDARTA